MFTYNPPDAHKSQSEELEDSRHNVQPGTSSQVEIVCSKQPQKEAIYKGSPFTLHLVRAWLSIIFLAIKVSPSLCALADVFITSAFAAIACFFAGVLFTGILITWNM